MCRCHFSRTNETGVASMIGRLALAAASAVLIVVPAMAQNQPAAPRAQVRGTIEKVDAANLTVKSREGGDVKVAVTDTTRIQSLVKKTLTDVKAGDFLASTGMKGTDGKIHAIEVRILPQATPDGGRQYDWDRGSGSVMTNATVGTVTEAPQGKLVHVKFKDGESEYSIGPDVPILAPVPGDKSLLKPGAAVFLAGPKGQDGTVTATFIYVEKDGIKPPM
jgi:hypothetical protein